MHALAWIFCLLARAPEAIPRPVQPPGDGLDALRQVDSDDAKKYHFPLDVEDQTELELVPRPIMRWATNDDWSGDVFLV